MTEPRPPVYKPEEAKEKLCPVLSTIERVNCQPGVCVLWDWLILPIPALQSTGIGKCSLPRRAYVAIQAEVKKAKKIA